MRCPRAGCGGNLLASYESLRTSVWVCLLCGREFMRLGGELFAVSGRPPTEAELRERRHQSRPRRLDSPVYREGRG